MSISLYNITKNQITMLKGFGMLLIVLHNFLHMTYPCNMIGENEFTFQSTRVFDYINLILTQPQTSISALFSFWGHFGVQLFIFASGYGLTKQFINNKPTSYKNYIFPKLLKIYALLLLGLLCYFLILYPQWLITFKMFKEFVLSSLLLYNNFSFDTIFSYPFSGPIWYFSLIIQLYIIFPLLYYIIDRYKEKGFFLSLIISFLLIYGLLPVASQLNVPLFANSIGHLPEFILGIALAKLKDFKLSYKTLFPIILSIFILSNFFKYFHPLGYLSVTIVILMLLNTICDKLPFFIQKIFMFIGAISMFMFVINGPLRTVTIPIVSPISGQLKILVIAFIHLVITVLLSYLISLFYNKMVPPILNKIIRSVVK